MITVIGVRFKTGRRIYYFDPIGLEVTENDSVIVETARGVEFAEVAEGPHEVEDAAVIQPLKPIVRIATAEDRRKREEYASREPEAFEICEKKIRAHELDMKLVSAEYTFDGSKLIFCFTADERVDFRELVRDLASQFHTRIELRQIGVRDEAKMLGGLGPCGRPVCCNSFLDDFRPVSIKMAKEQNLSLSPTKISGLCGRLMCCLQYEQEAYEDAKKRLPRLGREMEGPDGIGTVVENNAITERTKLRLQLPDGSIDVREYDSALLTRPGEEALKQRAAAAENAQNVSVPQTEGEPGKQPETPAPQEHRGRPERRERPEFRRRKEPKKTLEEHVAQVEAEAAQADQTGAAGGEKPKRPRNRHRGGKGREPGTAVSGGTEHRAEGAAGSASGEGGEDSKKRFRSRRRRPRPEGAPAGGNGEHSEHTPGGNE